MAKVTEVKAERHPRPILSIYFEKESLDLTTYLCLADPQVKVKGSLINPLETSFKHPVELSQGGRLGSGRRFLTNCLKSPRSKAAPHPLILHFNVSFY